MTQPQTQTPALDDLGELIGTLKTLRHVSPLQRARLVAELENRTRAVLGRVADEACFQAVNEVVGARRRTHKETGEAIGVSADRVNQRVTDYRRWLTNREVGQ